MTGKENKKTMGTAEGEIAEEFETPSTGCGIMARYPVLSILIFAGSGIGLGFGLSAWDPEDGDDKSVALKWIGLIGDMVR